MFSLSTNFSIFNNVVLLESSDSLLIFGTLEEIDEKLKERLLKSAESFFSKKNLNGTCQFRIVSEEIFNKALVKQYGSSDESKKIQMPSEDSGTSVLLLDSILNEAIKLGATDIHIEENQVRFRIGGILRKILSLSQERNRELVRRIKVLSKLNVLESRRGQDGQFRFEEENRSVFVRVSIIPSVSSIEMESVVLRLLDPRRIPLDLPSLGFSETQCHKLKEMIKNENGLILICGPTGSGKSTTAASLLIEIGKTFSGGKKLISIEDPVEYILPEVTQIMVNDLVGMSFEESLRLIFRQDPDVIFVGEIRDSRTAKTVIQASLTGHLVIATFHTKGFYETVLRMKDLGVEWQEIFSVLRGIVRQRLVNGCNLESEILNVEEGLFDNLKIENGFVSRKDFSSAVGIYIEGN